MSEQELNLIEFAAGEVTEPCATAPQVMRCKLSMPAREAASRTISHSTFGVIPVPQTRPVLLMDRNSAPSVMPAAFFHSSIAAFTHEGIGTVRICPLAQQVGDNPVFLAQLDGINPQREQLTAAQSASD